MMYHPARRRLGTVAAVVATAALVLTTVTSTWAQETPTYTEQYRPQFHYTHGQGFVNDPNGLVYYEGEYHMFYQDRLDCRQSWGHAISRDLVHWTELGIAIPCEGNERIFSGSIVIDWENRSGFGTSENPPMVAIYTSARPGNQSQSLAYSLDRGRTWTKYEGNPVLDIGSRSFRDPKVFWYEPRGLWIMPVSLSSLRQIAFYSSPDLKNWTFESTFGPVGAVTGEYEVPDLFPLEVKGKGTGTDQTKWVLLVNVNPGARLGGSALQYFVGEFDGHRFAEESVEPFIPPAGEVVFEDFESTDYGAWTTTGTAFGTGPAAGTLPGQDPVVGHQGERLANSHLPEDEEATGTLTSPTFEIEKDYVNFLVGGADAPMLEGTSEQATVNLIVDGERVRTATGDNSAWLDWNAWDVSDLVGEEAQIELVDNATDDEESILVDQITFADGPALSGQDRTDWADWGRDFYAAITYDNVPDDRRLMVGWMSNWQYTGDVPTSPWQSTQSEPRELTLERVDGELQLVQEPVDELKMLRHSPYKAKSVPLNNTTRQLNVSGKALDIELDLSVSTADRAGIKVFTGDGEETVIGYDATTRELYVDRTRSGNVDFHPRFASVSRAPLDLAKKETLELRILVDHMLVEVFADDGRRVFTETVFPDTDSEGLEVFADGGRATVRDLRVWQMESIWFPDTGT
jgi:sucrose-6-phosphate hydrolase SacC (GH32 family)